MKIEIGNLKEPQVCPDQAISSKSEILFEIAKLYVARWVLNQTFVLGRKKSASFFTNLELLQQAAKLLLTEKALRKLGISANGSDFHISIRNRSCNVEIDEAVKRKAQKRKNAESEVVRKFYGTRMGANIKLLSKVFNLSKVELKLFRFVCSMHMIPTLKEFFEEVSIEEEDFELRLLAKVCNLTCEDLANALKPKARLKRLGLLEEDSKQSNIQARFQVPAEIKRILLSANLTTDSLQALLFQVCPHAQLTFDDFLGHRNEIEIARSLLKAAIEGAKPGCNILIWGPPGTGKTELARLLANEGLKLGSPGVEIPVHDEDGKEFDGTVRLQRLAAAQGVLENVGNRPVVFDEIEDVFPKSSFFFFDFSEKHASKGYFNEVLDRNTAPVIWVSNAVHQIDTAHLRRFSFCIEVSFMTDVQRKKVIAKHSEGLSLENETIDWLANARELSPAVLEKVLKGTLTALSSQAGSDLRKITADEFALNIAENYLAAMNLPATNNVAKATPFNDKFTQCDIGDLGAFLNGLPECAPMKMLFYGIPGSGKSQLAREAARKLGVPILVKRASDIVSKWLGETERNIARAFKEAAVSGSLLLIDEADSMMNERKGSGNAPWHASIVCELLTQLECYDGWAAFTTNYLESIDEAALRRFDLKVKFEGMRPDQISKMLEEVAGFSEQEVHSRFEEIQVMKNCTPGDFACISRKFRMKKQRCSIDEWLINLNQELALKIQNKESKIGFIRV